MEATISVPTGERVTANLTGAMELHRTNFITSALLIGALKFGSFTLKSGRWVDCRDLDC